MQSWQNTEHQQLQRQYDPVSQPMGGVRGGCVAVRSINLAQFDRLFHQFGLEQRGVVEQSLGVTAFWCILFPRFQSFHQAMDATISTHAGVDVAMAEALREHHESPRMTMGYYLSMLFDHQAKQVTVTVVADSLEILLNKVHESIEPTS